jgi:hypothetical protein
MMLLYWFVAICADEDYDFYLANLELGFVTVPPLDCISRDILGFSRTFIEAIAPRDKAHVACERDRVQTVFCTESDWTQVAVAHRWLSMLLSDE